jgi:hypothetical protein
VGPPDICSSETGLSVEKLRDVENGGTVRVSVLRFESITSIIDGAVTQFAKAWESDYNIAALSMLLRRGVYGEACGNPTAALYGVNSSRPVMPETRGEACAWVFAPSGMFLEASGGMPTSCRATEFRILQHNVSGRLPTARQRNDLAALTATKMYSGEVTVGWRLMKGDEQQVEATLASEARGPTLFGTPVVRQSALSCQTGGQNFSMAVPPAEAAWALQYPTILPVRIDAVRHQKLLQRAADGVNLIAIFIRDGVTGQAQLK